MHKVQTYIKIDTHGTCDACIIGELKQANDFNGCLTNGNLLEYFFHEGGMPLMYSAAGELLIA